jgi:hypothetical protein
VVLSRPRWKPAMPASLSLAKHIATACWQLESRGLKEVGAMAGNFAALSLRGTRPQISVYCCLPFFAHASIFLAQLAYVVVELGI